MSGMDALFGFGGGAAAKRLTAVPSPAAIGAAPAAPKIGDANVQAAGTDARANAAAAFGRYATVLSSAAGDTTPAPAVKKTLLGGIV